MTPVVSVVVPTYRRTQLILRCLDALLAQEFDPADYEIIVVDNAASADTRDAIAAWVQEAVIQRCEDHNRLDIAAVQEAAYPAGAPGTVTLVRRPVAATPDMPEIRYIPANGRRGPAAARNCGWRAAQAGIIAFTDDDCIPDPEWLRAGVQVVRSGHDGACGRVIVPLPPHPTDHEVDALGLERSEFITANCFYRRSTLEAVGGFDERFTMAWREDSDLYFTLLEGGSSLAFVDDALVYHPVRPARWGISLSQQKKAVYNALLYKKHPRLYRRKIQPRPPWHYYIAVAGLMLGVTGLLLGQASLAGLGISSWMLATAAFTLVRLRGTSKHVRHIAEMVFTSILIPPLAVYWRLRGAFRFRALFI